MISRYGKMACICFQSFCLNLSINPFSMKNNHTIVLALMMVFFSISLGFGQDETSNSPLFTKVVYEGKDQVYQDNPLSENEFYNPILQGCYPDPSITKKGEDYYLVVSSFAMFPGVPIFHSNDLVNWTQIGHVLDRKTQLKVHDAGISEGIYAPDILYNPHNDTFYMITTQFAGGFGNIVVKTKDPKQGWSDPIKLKFGGIDPAMFFDEDGKAYVVHNDAPDKGNERYEGHRVIKIWEYDLEEDQVIAGTDQIIVDGGVDPAKNPIWIEAPHIYKKEGTYFLMCAEGGTGDNHSEVIFVSDHPKGPYTPAPSNPILTQRYFGPNRSNKVDWAGHADLVMGPDDKYYGVFLGIRPNDQNRVNTGRETFILPVDWSGEFPVFENGLIPLEPKLKMPTGITENKTGQAGYFPNGNFTYTEEFTSEDLDFRWIGLRGPREDFIAFQQNGLRIKPFPVNIKEVKPTSTLFYRQQHKDFEFTTTMEYQAASETELAGITSVQSENFNYVFGVTKKGADQYILLERTEKGTSKIISSTKINTKGPIQLRVKANGDDYEFGFAVEGGEFTYLPVSGDILSTNVAGGFTGNIIGLYATTANDAQPE
jgi:alpha-N-arabinofuranosidase